jgi:molybdopterin/thiamine biosynthesis adenylyltransferase
MDEKRPRLKDLAWIESGKRLILTQDAGIEIIIDRPDPEFLDLLHLLDGTNTIDDLTSRLQGKWRGVGMDAVAAAIDTLNHLGAVEDEALPTSLTPREQSRYTSNLAFFGTFATLDKSRSSIQEDLCRSSVLLLGAGGIGSTVLANLAGLGVGSVIVVDGDTVELKNLARQFLYSEADLGQPKAARAVARARAINSAMRTDARRVLVDGTNDIARLLKDVDLVICTIDEPDQVRSWVNEACVSARIPFIVGGVWAQRAHYMSVRPGESGCLNCLALAETEDSGTVLRPATRINRGIGPVTSILGGLMAAEVLRFLTGLAEPVGAARMWVVDAVSGRVEVAGEWPRTASCEVCSSVSIQDTVSEFGVSDLQGEAS